MYLGPCRERGRREDVFGTPFSSYTKALLSCERARQADPRAAKERIKLQGRLPSALSHSRRVPLCPRCWKVQDKCRC